MLFYRMVLDSCYNNDGMKKNRDLLKIELNDSWGLFPVRQNIQDGIRSIQFNDFTAFLWDHLGEYNSTEELLNYCREELEQLYCMNHCSLLHVKKKIGQI